MPPFVLWVTRLQAVAMAGLAIAVVVLAATSTTSLGIGFVITEVIAATFGAWLFGLGTRYRRARTPILLLEIIAVGIAGQLFVDSRPLIGVAVGVPALVVTVGILLAARSES